MQTAAVEPRPNVTPHVASPSEDALHAELLALNEELRELKSSDLAVRAYVEAWLALVACSISGKLLWDSFVMKSKYPLAAFPLLLLGLLFLVDAITAKVRQRRLAAHETIRLARQRELRTVLGVDDAPVPPLAEPALS